MKEMSSSMILTIRFCISNRKRDCSNKLCQRAGFPLDLVLSIALGTIGEKSQEIHLNEHSQTLSKVTAYFISTVALRLATVPLETHAQSGNIFSAIHISG